MIEIGMIFGKRYKILGSLGSGGMANVFLAHDLILKRDVALKMLRSDFQNDPSALRRFKREALAATELVHPEIVQVYDVGEEDNIQYLVMEYVDGMDLKKYLKANSPLPGAEIVRIMTQILKGLQVAHDHQIVHRDLKPQNILMDFEGNAKITDFGIAIALSDPSITQTNSMLGSVHYLSPEQARGNLATNRSDIYAMGIILFEMMTGRVPFDGDSAVTIALKHFQVPLPRVRDFNPHIPQSMENVALIATAKNPEDRFSTADEMRNDLASVLSLARLSESRVFVDGVNERDTKKIKPIKKMPADLSETSDSLQDPADKIIDLYKRGSSPEKIAKKLGLPVKKLKNFLKKAAKEGKIQYPRKRNKRKIILIITGVFLALILLLSIAMCSTSSKEVAVPDLQGLTEEEARRHLEKLELAVGEIFQIESAKVAKGKVVKTDPQAEVNVKEGRKIDLYISKGAEKIELEDYVGQDFEQVKEELRFKGYKLKLITKTEQSSEEYDAGLIISQSIDSGKKVTPNSTKLEFVVSSGSSYLTLGNYVGKNVDTARLELQKLGLSASQIKARKVTDSGKPAGIVVNVEPGNGASINKKRGVITLEVSDGMVEIPSDLVGSQEDFARKSLGKLGLSVSVRTEKNDTYNKGQIISVEQSGTVAMGSTVTIVVSEGKTETTPSSKKATENSSSSSSSSSSGA